MFLKGKPKKGNFSYFGIWFWGLKIGFCEGGDFLGGVFSGWFVYVFATGFVLVI